MRGLPKRFGTKADIENCMKLVKTPADKAELAQKLQMLLDGRFIWKRAEKITSGVGLTDATHKVQLEPADGNALNGAQANMEKWQYVQEEDSGADIFRLGLTAAKVQKYINELK